MSQALTGKSSGRNPNNGIEMHVFNVRLDRIDPAITLLVAQFSSEHSVESILELIYDAYPGHRSAASALVMRPDVRDTFSPAELEVALEGAVSGDSPFLERLAAACQDGERSFARFQLLPIFILHFHDGKAVLSSNINPLVDVPPDVELHLENYDVVGDIRTGEMRHVMSVSGALLPPLENTFYENPSGRRARAFLRVGNIQYSRLAIDSVTFWLLPYVFECEALLVDTWSLSSIAFNTSRVLASTKQGKPIPVEMLSQYQDNSAERRSALIEILQRLLADAGGGKQGNTLKVTCLVSVTHTGSLVNVLMEQVRLSGLPIELSFVAVFRLGPGDRFETLCDLSEDPEFEPLTAEEMSDRSAVQIDDRVYFPVTYTDIPFEVVQPQAKIFKPFVDLVQGSGLISVHRDQVDDGKPRHHAVHLDTEVLAGLSAFRARFREAILGLDPLPSLVLSPDHSAARALSDLACRFLEEHSGLPSEAIFHSNLDLKTAGLGAKEDLAIADRLAQTEPDSSILVLDDCFITGARLSGYQTRLRQRNITAKLHYLVAVARPDDLATWEDFKRKLSFRTKEYKQYHHDNTVTAVLEIVLPNWQQEKCPWCQERLLYERLESEGDKLPGRYGARRVLLAQRDLGLRDDLFLDPEISEIKLYPASIFAPPDSSQAEVFSAVAAAIQVLRIAPPAGKPRLGPRRHPVATVLDFNKYLRTMFTDTVIRASFLRAATWEELVYTDRETEGKRSERIAEIIAKSEGDEANLALELILAGGLMKLTVPGAARHDIQGDDDRAFFELTKKRR
ncbi:hypothetical protein E2F50_19485 [Rhizobium deserti]|uniref:Uncharacterized protein n=1 Tax=Rhizobium deserti TaxID=2547961 RepID=A0A4V3ANL2_9HYPH|nr:hypothetical protein [Rhizobium deserti]TDK31845.1 hypothetical protein E2F50_19485 [Rhizobium deserti]